MNFWKRKSVLVTGANGLVGSWLTDALVGEGADVTAYIRDQVRDSNLTLLGLGEKINLVKGDVLDAEQLGRVFNEYEVEICFHLAAQSIVRIGNAGPYPTLHQNIMGTVNVLEGARNSKKTEKVILASSDKAYGTSGTLPYTEETPLRGAHAYDVSKSCADLIGRCYSVSYSLPVNIIRSGNIYGGGDFNWSRIVPNTVRRIHEGKPPTLTGNGSMVRDFVHVDDVVSGYMLAAERGLCGEAYNLGTEKPTSILNVAQLIASEMGYGGKPLLGGDGTRQIDAQWLNWEKAKAQLDWQPTIKLEDGIKDTVSWYSRYLSKENPCKGSASTVGL